MSRTRRAAKAFEDFKGEKPAKLRLSHLPDKDVTGWEMGPMVGVAYEARRDGKTQQYFHEFKPAARPRLVAQDDGRKLYIDGGRYRVTDRGIEDMPNLFVVNPARRPGKSTSKTKGSTVARTRRRKRRSQVSVFTTNPRRRRRAARSRTIFAVNPRRRRRARSAAAAPARRRVYRRNPVARARRATRRYKRNPSPALKGLSQMLMPAIFIGLGAVGTEIACGYLPIPVAWKTGPMRYVVKGAVGVALGLLIARLTKQKRIGYYFAAGAVAIATHDFVKTWLASSVPSIKGLGYVNPAGVVRFGQYGRQLPLNRLGQYGPPMRSQFGGAATQPNARQPGGEMNFAA